MEIVKTKHDLKRTTADIVFVNSLKKLFVRDGDEWIIKEYFTVEEVVRETELPLYHVMAWSSKLNLGHNGKFRLDEVLALAKVKKLREQKVRFKDISKLILK